MTNSSDIPGAPAGIPGGISNAPADISSASEPLVLRTKPNRHFPFLSRHPWVLATALAHGTDRKEKQSEGESPAGGETPPDGRDTFGQTAELFDHDGNWIARGLYNSASRLRLRLYSFDADEPVNDELFAGRIEAAVARRRLTPVGGDEITDGGERLIFSEADRLSGLIVDRYADCLSIQFTSAALLSRGEFLIDRILEAVAKHGAPCSRVVCRMDAATAKHEGVSQQWITKIESWSRGMDGAEASLVWYRHHQLKMAIDMRDGQKTGGYLDQQDNHAIAASYMAGRKVLDICTYTGGFALSAALAGAAEVIGVDSSEKALELARQNAAANSLDQVSFEKADCFENLKQRGEAGEKFDAIILDPPRFAGSRRQVDAALRAYARLNMSAVDLLNPGGILVTCSCSGHVSRSDFLNMLVDVGRKRRRDLVILRSLGPSPDHPCAVSCPESDYLKCVIAQVA